ncbi:alkene reductase [Streptomyces sp. 3211]|uniref:alkene reductase n=1 Tax=Streptomyces sp. 3211 TaxID=1964449 RepID=UPI0009A4DC50|nr:alkene reductase [Streptomyces sp. 3211]
MTKDLFDTVRVGTLTLPNRLAMAPMSRSRADDRGCATSLMARYYAQRATAGLIITESIHPSERGRSHLATPGLHSAEQMRSWREVTGAVHAAGGRIFAQLAHGGRIGHPILYSDAGVPVAPSAVASGGMFRTADNVLFDHPVPRALLTGEVRDVVAEFETAARLAVEAGFDGVELHGGNGHLIHQFLGDNTNLRSDGYGGSAANRIRFAAEVVEAVAEAIGPHRTAIRLSPGNPYNGMEEAFPASVYACLLDALPRELAYLHIVEWESRTLVEMLWQRWNGVFMLNPRSGTLPRFAGAFGSVEGAFDALGCADVVSLGGLWLSNPDLPARIRVGGPFAEPDMGTVYRGGHRGYDDYPML